MNVPPNEADTRLLGDMPAEELLRHGRAVLERVAAYLAEPEKWPVLPPLSPGDLAAALPVSAPQSGEPFDRILSDFDSLIMPATTHWNHPGFMAYFATSGSAVGILGETLSAMLNVNAMLWRTGPAATELEQVTLDWLRQMLGLPAGLDGHINDTASTSTLHALAAAREGLDLDIRDRGLAGRADVPPLAVYCSEEAHSSVDKAVITLGLGLEAVRHVSTDSEFRMDVAALERAIAADSANGVRPMAVVATVGSTGVTAIDPVAEIADVCARANAWLHVDAAYGGSAALVPEMRHVLAGCERADSIVVNPHKWMFVPIDCSVLYTRRPDLLKRAFSLVPEYLTTTGGETRNLMEYGVALGRRFRALKLWFVLRYFGTDGMAARLREHLRLAQAFAGWVDGEPDFERLAPTQFSVIAFRHAPRHLRDRGSAAVDAHNASILEYVNASGEVYLSHTKVRGQYAIRVAIGNIRTTEAHVRRAWELVVEGARRD